MGHAMTKFRKQADTRPATTRSIVASRQFARGFDEGRKGLPFNSETATGIMSAAAASPSSRHSTCLCGSVPRLTRKLSSSLKRRFPESF
jgi:hypothetical protein